MPARVVRLVLLLMSASLAREFSGVREVAIDLLLALYDHACSYTIKATPVFTELKAMPTEEIRFEVHKAAGLHLARA